MTELKFQFTKSFVKRAAACAMAVCLGVSAIPSGASAAIKNDYSTDGYYDTGVYDPETGKGGYYDPANVDGVYAPTDLTVTADKTTLKKGETAQITAELQKPEGSKAEIKSVTYKSDDWQTASVSGDGTVTANGKGVAVITVTVAYEEDRQMSKEVNITVEEADTPSDDGYYDPSNADGYYNPASADGYYAPKSVTVTADKTELAKGETAVLTQTVEPEGSKVDVAWTYELSEGDKAAADVTADGKVTAKEIENDKVVTVQVTGTYGENKTVKGIITITIKGTPKQPEDTKPVVVDVTAVTLNKKEIKFDEIGDTETLQASVAPLNATDPKVTWTSDNEKVAAVADGKVTAVGNGTATITAKAGNQTAAAVVTVSQKSKKVAITLDGQTVKGTLKAKIKKSYTFKAVVTPENTDAKNAKVTWKSSNKKVAKVNSKGKVTILKAGTAKITATTADKKKTSITLKADKKAIKVSKLKISGKKTMKAKRKQTLKVTVTPATADNRQVTWKSSKTSVATVNKNGKVTAKRKGTVKITATAKDGSGKKATFTIKVK